MQVFSLEVQRRARLRHAKQFNLEPLLGEKVIVHIGELPQSQQGKLVESMELRRELAQRSGSNAAGEPGAGLTEELAVKMIKVQQDLITAALLDAKGDRMSAEDARMLFDLLPVGGEAAALVQEMMTAVYERIGGKKKPEASSPAEADAAPGK